MHHERNANADEVESQHWQCEDTHGERIWSRANDGGDDEDDENGVFNVVPEKTRAHDAEEREKHDQDGQLERDAKSEDHRKKQVGVFVDLDEWIELFAIGEQEIERAREDP